MFKKGVSLHLDELKGHGTKTFLRLDPQAPTLLESWKKLCYCLPSAKVPLLKVLEHILPPPAYYLISNMDKKVFHFVEQNCGTAYLLGQSRHPLQKYLKIPFRDRAVLNYSFKLPFLLYIIAIVNNIHHN